MRASAGNMCLCPGAILTLEKHAENVLLRGVAHEIEPSRADDRGDAAGTSAEGASGGLLGSETVRLDGRSASAGSGDPIFLERELELQVRSSLVLGEAARRHSVELVAIARKKHNELRKSGLAELTAVMPSIHAGAIEERLAGVR